MSLKDDSLKNAVPEHDNALIETNLSQNTYSEKLTKD